MFKWIIRLRSRNLINTEISETIRFSNRLWTIEIRNFFPGFNFKVFSVNLVTTINKVNVLIWPILIVFKWILLVNIPHCIVDILKINQKGINRKSSATLEIMNLENAQTENFSLNPREPCLFYQKIHVSSIEYLRTKWRNFSSIPSSRFNTHNWRSVYERSITLGVEKGNWVAVWISEHSFPCITQANPKKLATFRFQNSNDSF